jgi:hypothetical protein
MTTTVVSQVGTPRRTRSVLEAVAANGGQGPRVVVSSQVAAGTRPASSPTMPLGPASSAPPSQLGPGELPRTYATPTAATSQEAQASVGPQTAAADAAAAASAEDAAAAAVADVEDPAAVLGFYDDLGPYADPASGSVVKQTSALALGALALVAIAGGAFLFGKRKRRRR